NQDGDSWGIFAQRFDAAGTPQGAEFQVNTTTAAEQQFPAVAADARGGFTIAWSSHGQDPDQSWGVYAQRFDAAGARDGSEFRVNTTTADDQEFASVASPQSDQ